MTSLRVALDKSKANINSTPKGQSTLGVSFRYSEGEPVKVTRDRKGVGTIIHDDSEHHTIGHSGTRTTTIHERYMTLTTNTRLRHRYKVIASPPLRTIRSKEGMRHFYSFVKMGRRNYMQKRNMFSFFLKFFTGTADITNVVVQITNRAILCFIIFSAN